MAGFRSLFRNSSTYLLLIIRAHSLALIVTGTPSPPS